jgi:hypothetical protein
MREIKYEISETNPCFEQMALFVLQEVAQIGCVNFKLVLEKIVKNKNDLASKYDELTSLHTGPITMRSTEEKGLTTISNASDWLKYEMLLTNARPDIIEFETDFENQEVSPTIVTLGNKTEARPMVRQRLHNAIGGAYENCKEQIIQSLGSNPLNWPSELQFFRHSRNASFHNNIFDIRPFRGTPTIDPNSPPQWKNLIIPDDSVNGQNFAGAFFQYHLLLPFLAEMGEVVNNL